MTTSRARLMPRLGERQFRAERERNRERASCVLREFIRGDCEAIARAANGRWSARLIRYWTEADCEKPSPLETAAVFIAAVREGSSDRSGDALLDWLCRESGGRYERGESLTAELAGVEDSFATLVFAKASLTAAAIRANADGVRTPAERAELLRHLAGVEEAAEQFKAALTVEDRGPVRVGATR